MKLKIKDIGNVVTGKTPSTSDKANFGKGYLFITPKELHTDTGIIHNSERQLTQKGFESIRNNTIFGLSVLVGCIGSDMGNVALVDKKCATNQQINAITNIHPKICNPYYLYYWLRIQKKYLFKIANATTTPILKKSDFENIKIDFQKINIQNNIVKFLRTIDLKIANNNAISKELESISKTIYDYWFLQFEFPNKDGKPYKSNGGKMVWNNQLKQEIPEGWKVSTVKNILGDYPRTKTIESKEYDLGTLYPIIDQSKDTYICGYTNDKEKVLNLTDAIVFGDHSNKSKYVNFPFARGADGTQILNSNNPQLPNYLLYQEIISLPEIEKGYSRHFKFLKAQNVTIPTLDTAKDYINIVSNMLLQQREIIKENQQLQSLRDFLLPILMNGQVTFNN